MIKGASNIRTQNALINQYALNVIGKKEVRTILGDISSLRFVGISGVLLNRAYITNMPAE